DAALVVDVHAGGVDEERLGGPELHLQARGDGEGALGPGGRQLGGGGGNGEQQGEERPARPATHDWWRLRQDGEGRSRVDESQYSGRGGDATRTVVHETRLPRASGRG